MRNKVLIYGSWILGVILLQSILRPISIFGVKPNLIVIFVTIVGLLRNNVEASIIGLILGALLDVITGKTIGFYSLLGLYLGAISGSLNKKFYRDNVFVAMLMVFLFTMLYEFAVYIFGVYVQHQGDVWYAMTRVILPEAVYNSVVSIFIFGLVLKMSYIFERQGERIRRY